MNTAVARLAIAIAAVIACPAAATSRSAPLGTTIPANCIQHTTFGPDPDVAGDHRCAGLAIAFHHDGPASSPHPLWAGQWLFRDEAGLYRVGTCTFQRGVHPNALSAASPVAQTFPLDGGGIKRRYLTWRYGDTTDNLTAAAMWAVLHYYAQDSAGTSRSSDASAPLIPDLARIAEMTGNQQIEDAALALDGEATMSSGDPLLMVALGGGDLVIVSVAAGVVPLAGVAVIVTRLSDAATIVVATGADGTASVDLPLGAGGGSVEAVAALPGDAVVYAGPPSAPSQTGVQTLITAGPPRLLQAQATRPPDATTTTTATATLPPTTVTTLPPPPSTAAAPPPATSPQDANTTTSPQDASTTTSTTTTTTTATATLPPTTTTTLPPSAPPTTLPPPMTTTTTLPPTTLTPTTVPPTTTTLPSETTATTTAVELPVDTTPPAPDTSLALVVFPSDSTASTSSTTRMAPTTPSTVAPPPSFDAPPLGPPPTLPRTGGGSNGASYIGTALLVGGIGLIGTARRPVSDQPASRREHARRAVSAT